MTKSLEQTIHSIMSEMFEVQQKSKAFVDLIASGDTLSQNHIMLLIQLRTSERMKITDIATTFHISAGAATSMCDKLEKMKLVTRVREKDDRRVVFIVLTDQGTQKTSDIFKKLPMEKLEDIAEVFRKVNQLMETIL